MSKLNEIKEQLELTSITLSKLALLLVDKKLISKEEWKKVVDEAFKEMEVKE